MEVDDNPTKGKRVWLQPKELDKLYRYNNSMPAEIALKLMGMCGLRTKEVLDVEYQHIVEADTDGRVWKLRVVEGKGEDGGTYRETILPNGLREQIRGFVEGYGIPHDEQLIQKRLQDSRLKPATRRTLQHWVKKARDEFAEKDENWSEVSCHDLRRSWANQLLENDASPVAVMQLGGWTDYETFRDHYMNGLSDENLASNVAGAF